jgi:hypothetical protein
VDAIANLSRQLSHDLNNSLMIVTGYAEELLAELPENDRRRPDVRSILSAAESMAGIAGELHGFTRKQASPAAATELGVLLTAVAARIREEIGATLVLRLSDKRLFALADATQLEAVLLSIARRLRDKIDPHMILLAGPKSIGEMSNLELALKPGDYVEIALRGPFASEVPASSFESFLSGKNPHGGDMARAYAIVREWGGTILTGRSDHTSEVRVLLPGGTEPAQPGPEDTSKQAAAPAAPAMSTATPEAEAGAVLVVEDETGIRALVRKILEREGYTVVESDSAEEAMEVTRRRATPFRLLIADLKLPGKSGHELAEALSALYPALRVLYISGYTDDAEEVTRDVGAGAAFLQKPFTLAALLKKVREALGPAAKTARE